MLEILLIAWLARSVAKMATAKGHNGGGYKAMLILLWFGGEIAGIVVGLALGLEFLPAYGIGIVAAIAGAVITFVVVSSLTPVTPMMPPQSRGFPVIQSPQRPPY